MKKYQDAIAKTADFIKHQSEYEGSGHDWWHIYRVWQMATQIALQEKAVNLSVVELAALLHDLADWKFNKHDAEDSSQKAAKWLEKIHVDPETIKLVREIINKISFKGSQRIEIMPSLEGQIVQDADRLDAMGATGIARAFAYGGYVKRPLYDPSIPLEKTDVLTNRPTLNHFYEKLFLLKNLMHTSTGKKIAQERHTFMKEYVRRFLKEWSGEI
jgi:uncharacterized protein